MGSNFIIGYVWVWFNSCFVGGDDVEGDVFDFGFFDYIFFDEFFELLELGIGSWFCGGNGGIWSLILWN